MDWDLDGLGVPSSDDEAGAPAGEDNDAQGSLVPEGDAVDELNAPPRAVSVHSGRGKARGFTDLKIENSYRQFNNTMSRLPGFLSTLASVRTAQTRPQAPAPMHFQSV